MKPTITHRVITPSATHGPELVAWITAIGLRPADIFHAPLLLTGGILHYRAFVRDDDGHILVRPGADVPMTETRRIECSIPPPADCTTEYGVDSVMLGNAAIARHS